jgi:FKBP-type peptidyl-prolyl cis-trans isomerase
MATPRSQRIGIWIIAIVMAVGTFLSFYVMALGMQNQQIDQEKAQREYSEQQKLAAQLNAENSEALEGYSSRKFDADKVTELAVEVLKEGEGAVVKTSDTLSTSYFGWLSDGTIFDSSKKKSTADAPIELSLSGVIRGWTEGLAGQKVGSIVRLTIPADQAYSSQESGIIPANSPLEFIVQIHSAKEA